MSHRSEEALAVLRDEQSHATVNPCTLCAPLGAVLAAAGIEGTMPLLHGAQGCATYIRRYIISHFREPMDVASSSFTEASAVLGGESEFNRALDNIRQQYDPQLIAVGTTCLAETIGEDLQLMVARYRTSRKTTLPIVHASTPSYRDGHVEGYHAMVLSVVRALNPAADARDLLESQSAPAVPVLSSLHSTPDNQDCSAPESATITGTSHVSRAGPDTAGSSDQEGASRRPKVRVNVLPPIVSPADLRHLREIVEAYQLDLTLLPDYSDTLDAPISDQYHVHPAGGTHLSDIRAMTAAAATLDLTLPGSVVGAGDLLHERGVSLHRIGLPIGVEATDRFTQVLEHASDHTPTPWLEQERGRLLDAYADGHKYVFDRRIAVFGDPELVVGVAKFLLEIGAKPVLCATGARNRALSMELAAFAPGAVELVLEDTDFSTIETRCKQLGVELMIASSKGYRAARAMSVPLLRLGFPIHDRMGASRILSVGYRGTTCLFDSIVNALLQQTQDRSEVGFSYL